MTDDDQLDSRTMEFEAIFFALDEDSQSFLLETGRALVKRTERRASMRPRPKLSLVPASLLKPGKDGVDGAVKLVLPSLVSEPEGGQ